jgi:hypothetical protein
MFIEWEKCFIYYYNWLCLKCKCLPINVMLYLGCHIIHFLSEFCCSVLWLWEYLLKIKQKNLTHSIATVLTQSLSAHVWYIEHCEWLLSITVWIYTLWTWNVLGQILQFTSCFWFLVGKKDQSYRHMRATSKRTKFKVMHFHKF